MEPPGGQVARAGIAEGSVIGATEPIDGAIGASGVGIARGGWWVTVSCNEAVAGRGWGTVSCNEAVAGRGWSTVSCNEAVAGRGWSTVSCNGAVAGRVAAWGRWSPTSCDGVESDRGVA